MSGDWEDLNLLLKDRTWSEITRRVADFSRALTKQENRKNITAAVLKNLSDVLQESVKELKTDNVEIIELLTVVFRVLRNSCVGEPDIQRKIVENTAAVDSTCDIVKIILHSSDQEKIICLRVGVQFLGNLVVNNRQTQPIIWNKCSTVLLDLMKHEDDRVGNYSCMVMYNILLGCPDITSALEDYKQLLEILIEHAMKDSEFALFTIQLLLSRPGYLPKVYHTVNMKHRLFLLDCLHFMITPESKTSIPTCSLKFLADNFKTQSDCILKTCNTYVDTLEPAEVSKLLQFLASACAESTYQLLLQSDKSLLINCTMLLRSIHSLGKSGKNNFSVIQKMADLSLATRDSTVAEHPAFGFKSSLIQMLANLCWRHLDNQNKIRELDCIPVLMDCCNIDARNPLIIQWVVLTVHNLCESNRDNQAVIASMTTEGTLDSNMLLEMGLTIHADEDNKIVIVPLEKKTSSIL